jgi:hypothetical protein
MKQLQPLYILIIFVFLFTACQKNGEVIHYPSYGKLYINGILSAPLTVQIDGKIIDTLGVGSELLLPVEEGQRKVSLLDSLNNPVIDTLLTIEKREIKNLRDFFYTGNGILFPDLDTTRAPTVGKMLIRFVITDKKLPDEMRFVLFTLDYNTGAYLPVNKTIHNVRKDGFTDYIELDNPGDSYYVIEGYDLQGNKIMSIDNSSYGLIVADNNYLSFIPNNVLSMGIGNLPADGSLPYHEPVVIFQRVAQ